MVTSGNDWEEAWKAGNILYVHEVDGDAGVHPQKSFLEPSAEDQCPHKMTMICSLKNRNIVPFPPEVLWGGRGAGGWQAPLSGEPLSTIESLGLEIFGRGMRGEPR